MLGEKEKTDISSLINAVFGGRMLAYGDQKTAIRASRSNCGSLRIQGWAQKHIFRGSHQYTTTNMRSADHSVQVTAGLHNNMKAAALMPRDVQAACHVGVTF